MDQVVRRETQAWEADDDKTALLCLKNEKQFVVKILGQKFMPEKTISGNTSQVGFAKSISPSPEISMKDVNGI